MIRAVFFRWNILIRRYSEFYRDASWSKTFLMHLLVCIAFDIIFVGIFLAGHHLKTLIKELIQNRKLILKLAVNDFKTKYVGSYLGIIWAFIQPVVTVVVYWFVFSVGLRVVPTGNVPFVLYLVSGLVPWFFFSDSLSGGTSALIEYQYLVKKNRIQNQYAAGSKTFIGNVRTSVFYCSGAVYCRPFRVFARIVYITAFLLYILQFCSLAGACFYNVLDCSFF